MRADDELGIASSFEEAQRTSAKCGEKIHISLCPESVDMV